MIFTKEILNDINKQVENIEKKLKLIYEKNKSDLKGDKKKKK
jgi:hypothetical protein